MEKQCFKCSEVKPHSEFHKDKQMKDGLKKSCKTCENEASRMRKLLVRQDPEKHEKQKERDRKYYYRLGYEGKRKTAQERVRHVKRYQEKYPEKVIARNLSIRLKPQIKGNHLHHWSYRVEHAKDPIELPAKHHYFLHRHIVYDQEHQMYRRSDNGQLLNSRELHEDYSKSLSF